VAYDVFSLQPLDGGCGLFSDEARAESYGGILLAGFVPCMFVSCGVWDALAPILVGGALTTGALLFLGIVMLGILVSQ
jgi:hypothetical protein